MWFKNSFFVYNILYSGCENGMVLKTWPVQPPASHGFGLVWSGELDRNLVEPESDRVNRTVQPFFLFYLQQQFQHQNGSPNKPTLAAPQFQQQVGGPHAAKQRSVLRRPSSSNRPASLLPPTSPSPPHRKPLFAPAPPAGGTPFYCRQAGETKILNSHFKK